MNEMISRYHNAIFKKEATSAESGQRLDRVLLKWTACTSCHVLHRMIRKGCVRVNEKKSHSHYRLQSGDLIQFPLLKPETDPKNNQKRHQPSLRLLKQLEAVVLYEDEHIMALQKPAGWSVHAGTDHPFGIIELLRARHPDIPELNLVHRLDKPTSGLLLFAKTAVALRGLHQQLREKSLKKYYLALVAGHFAEGSLKLSCPLEKKRTLEGGRFIQPAIHGKEAETFFQEIQRGSHLSLVRIQPTTGRTHQIRVHAESMQCPILGDTRYFNRNHAHPELRSLLQTLPKQLYLHAYQAKFTHPLFHQTMVLTAPLPPYWKTALQLIGFRNQF